MSKRGKTSLRRRWPTLCTLDLGRAWRRIRGSRSLFERRAGSALDLVRRRVQRRRYRW